MNSKIPWFIVATSIIGSLILAIAFWSKLPDEMASHFGAGGQPDGWMSKTAFLAFMILMQVGLAVMMFGVGWLIRVLPPSMINLPNKEYWLAEERKDETIRDSHAMMGWIAAGTSVFLLVIFWFTIDANLDKNKQLNSSATWAVLAVYLVWLFGFLFLRLKKYYAVPRTES